MRVAFTSQAGPAGTTWAYGTTWPRRGTTWPRRAVVALFATALVLTMVAAPGGSRRSINPVQAVSASTQQLVSVFVRGGDTAARSITAAGGQVTQSLAG